MSNRLEAIKQMYTENRGQAREDIGWMLDRISELETELAETQRKLSLIINEYRHLEGSV